MHNNNFPMSQKEKDYISYCFSRAVKPSKIDLDYSSLFEGNKIEYDIVESKKEIKKIFGKQEKRSKKWARPSSNTSTSFLGNKMRISELFGILNILRFVNLEPDYCEEIESSVKLYFESYFSQIIEDEKTFRFLTEFFEICSEACRESTTEMLFERGHEIKNAELLDKFLASNRNIIQARGQLVKASLWTSEGGYSLLKFLLEKNENMLDSIFSSFDACFDGFLPENNKKSSFETFFAKFYSCSNPSQKSAIKEKLGRIKSKDIECLLSKLSISKK